MINEFEKTPISEEKFQQLRMKVTSLGQSLFGKRLCYPISKNIDPNYAAKVKEGTPFRTAAPIKLYSVETIEVFAVQVLPTANDRIVIMLNNDPKLQFDLKNPEKVLSKNVQDVNEAIRKQEENENDLTLFADVKLVTDTVAALNRQNSTAMDTFIEELMNQKDAIDSATSIIVEDAKAYEASLLRC